MSNSCLQAFVENKSISIQMIINKVSCHRYTCSDTLLLSKNVSYYLFLYNNLITYQFCKYFSCGIYIPV